MKRSRSKGIFHFFFFSILVGLGVHGGGTSLVPVVTMAAEILAPENSETGVDPESVFGRGLFGSGMVWFVSVKTANSQYLNVEGDATVHAKATVLGETTTFVLTDLNGGELMSGDKVRFQNAGLKTYLAAEGGGGREVKADRREAREWETFTIRKVVNGFDHLQASSSDSVIRLNTPFTLQAHTGQYVAAESSGAVNALRSRAEGSRVRAVEVFQFVPSHVPTPQTLPPSQGAATSNASKSINCPICSQVDWYDEWQDASKNSLDVAVLDPVGHQIVRSGLTPPVANATLRGKNWYPNGWEKETLCGTVDRFGITVADFASKDEWDWNVQIIPKPPRYTGFITNLQPQLKDGKRYNLKEWFPSKISNPAYCDSGNPCYFRVKKYDQLQGEYFDFQYCGVGAAPCPKDQERFPLLVEAEVTPTEGLRNNRWFSPVYKTSQDGTGGTYEYLAGGKTTIKELCAYGPWVREENHGYKPEIHPAEAFWWREGTPGQYRYFLMQVQDDSERFSKPTNFSGASTCLQPDGAGFCSDYVVRPEIASWWHPWAEPPRVGQFRIAFEVDPFGSDTKKPAYTIREREPLPREVDFPKNPSPYTRDVTPGIDHTLVVTKGPYNPNVRDHRPESQLTVLHVHERVRFPDKLGVRFDQICQDSVTKKLKGFIQISSAVGRDDDGHEGFLILQVDQRSVADPTVITGFKIPSLPTSEPPAPTANKPGVKAPVPGLRIFKRGLDESTDSTESTASTETPPTIFEEGKGSSGLASAPPSIRGKLVLGSVHQIVVNGKPQLVGDIEVVARGTADQPSADLAVTQADQVLGTEREPRVLKPYSSPEGITTRGVSPSRVVQEVVLDPTSILTLTLQGGENVPVPLESSLSVSPRLTVRPLPQAQPDPAVWDAWVGAAGASSQSPSSTQLPLVRPQWWQIDLTPIYAPLRDGIPSLEDESPIAEQLNETIRQNDGARLQQVFGSAQPFTIQWAYSARNLITGQPVAVKTDGAVTANDIRVEKTAGPFEGGALRVSFPAQPTPGLYEMETTVTIKDTLGNTGRFTATIWSHFLVGVPPDQMAAPLLRLLSTSTGIPLPELAELGSPKDAPIPVSSLRSPHTRQIQTLWTFVEQAVEDQAVSLEEFRELLGLAKQVDMAGSTRLGFSNLPIQKRGLEESLDVTEPEQGAKAVLEDSSDTSPKRP